MIVLSGIFESWSICFYKKRKMIHYRVVLGLGTILLTVAVGCDRSVSEWESAREARSVDAIKAFIEKYPEGKQIDEARTLLTMVQQEEVQWSEASKKGTLRALHDYLIKFPNSRFQKSVKEGFDKARESFKPENVLIIIKAKDGSDSLLGVWHGPVLFRMSGFIPSFVPPDPAQQNLAVAVLEGTGLIPQLKPGHAYIWLGDANFIEWREFPTTDTQPMVASKFGMPEGGSRLIEVPQAWLSANANKTAQ
jgi:hypothetical protein